MSEYHKIQSIFKRDSNTNKLIQGSWTLPEFEYLALNNWVYTEKVDGTNIRVTWENGKFTFGGRTDNAQIPATLINKLNLIFPPLKEHFRVKFSDGPVTLYGEGYSPKIQNGHGYKAEVDFVLFDIRIGPWWLQRADVEDIADSFELDVVPIIGTGSLYTAISKVSQGIISEWGDFISEGIVARPATELNTRGGQRLIVKIKHKDFK